jgi:hypothetical protein
VTSDVEEVASPQKALEQAQLLVIVSVSWMRNLSAKNSAVLCEILVGIDQVMSLRIGKWSSGVDKATR